MKANTGSAARSHQEKHSADAPCHCRCVRRAGAPRCPACLRRPLGVVVVAGSAFPDGTPIGRLTERARCWDWQFVESVEQARARLQEAPPDVLILSADPEQARSQRSRRQLGEALPGVPVLALVAVLEKGSILQILQDGATGVLVLPVTPAQVADAVRRLARGETVLCAQAQVASVQFFQDAERAASGAQLSYAERRVMQALILGKDNAGIAEQTGLGLETVHSHLTRIFKKLNVHNRKDAATKYLKLYGR